MAQCQCEAHMEEIREMMQSLVKYHEGIQETLGKVSEQVGPVLASLENSPVMKLLGVGK